jgi:hypothetical protein
MLESYANIYHLKHKYAERLFTGPVVIQEKIDGSQISFSADGAGGIEIRSKGARIDLEAPEKLFAPGVQQILSRASTLKPGWIYRAEYLSRPRHNVLAYDRIPQDNVILFDVETEPGRFLVPAELLYEAQGLGWETVPIIYVGTAALGFDWLGLLKRPSVLGGQDIEGVVIKNYFDMDPNSKKFPLMAKVVSKEFTEIHAAAWKAANPGSVDIITGIQKALATPARWNKAAIHLQERGVLTNSPQDIGALMREVRADVEKECREEIADKLMAWAMPKIVRGVAAGLPDWWKAKLAEPESPEPAQ